jgi:hypothetical protein
VILPFKKSLFLKRIIALKAIVLVVFIQYLNAQGIQDTNSLIIEEFAENTGNEIFDFTDLVLELEYYTRKPIVINKANREELENLYFLTPLEIEGILEYRRRNGNLISIYEIQSIPELSIEKGRLLSQYITITDDLAAVSATLEKRIKMSNHEILLHSGTTVQKRRGLLSINGQKPSYLGDSNRYLVRYRGHYENKLSYGIAAEKDIGEPWQKGGFDFYTAHFFVRDLTKKVKTLALGDYNISLGQGLILHTGFGRGKSAFTTQVKKGGYTLRPSAGVNEFLYFRGGAVTLEFRHDLETSLFFSVRKLDAKIRESIREEDSEENIVFFSTFQSSGLHRTQLELDSKNSVVNTTLGAKVKYNINRFTISANLLTDYFSLPMVSLNSIQNEFLTQQDALINGSIDYTYVYKNYHMFGETAVSSKGGISTLNGVLLGLHAKANIAILYRRFSPNYLNLNGNPFSETLQPQNEEGFYLGLDTKPKKFWTFNAYFDLWKHPWLRFNADAPSIGKEYLARLTYKKRGHLETYIHFRSERKERNFSNPTLPSRSLEPYLRQQFRWHIEYPVSKNVTLRNRIEMAAATQSPELPLSRGILILQDILYKPKESPLIIIGRFALFQTDHYSSRIYAYENDVRYSFSIPPYFGQGVRTYLNFRYSAIKNLSVEFRVSNTTYFQQKTIGSGNETIEGNKRTDIKLQIIYRT